MKRITILGFLAWISSCTPKELTREDLIGKWECVAMNGEPIQKTQFISVSIEFQHDGQTQQETHMNAWGGDVKTTSNGPWDIENGILKTKYGENEHTSKITVSNKNLIFSPDPLFNPESIKTSEYKRMQ
jgi:hypothetical protein